MPIFQQIPPIYASGFSLLPPRLLARVTDDRARDLPPELRERIAGRLSAIRSPTVWVDMVRQRVELDVATQARMLGESLPPGLKLIG